MQNPFKFLDSYTKDDREIFFGRDKEIEELYSRVFESKILLVYGVSGTGKSSLIQCGLANKFNESDWLPVFIRRGNDINESLIKALEKNAITPLKKDKTSFPLGRVGQGLQSLYLDHFKPIYLIFDQFEELFIFGADAEKELFLKQISNVVAGTLECKIIFVIREEYLANLTAFEAELPDLFQNRIRIEKMTRAKAKDAIEGPCRVGGIEMEEGFADELLNRLSPDKPEIELTYLQVYLDKVYRIAGTHEDRTAGGQERKNTGKIQFTIPLLEKAGRISDVLSDFLEEQIATIPDSEDALAVLKAFVSLEGTKKHLTIDEIAEETKALGRAIEKEKVERLIHLFVDKRILRDKDEHGRYELRHDSLAGKIYEKITLAEKELLEVRQFVENAYKNYQKRKVLLNESDLKYVALYEGKLYLKEQLNELIKKSKAETIKKKRRRRRVLIGVVALLFIVLSGFTLWALRERSYAVHALQAKEEAEEAKRIAEEKLSNMMEVSVVISATRMNIFYIGVDNPVDVAVSGYSTEKTFPTLIGAGNIRKDSKGGYLVSVDKPGKCEIDVSVEVAPGKKQRMGKHEFRVKYLPTPQSMFARKSGLCDLAKDELLSNEFVVAVMENFDFDIKCLVAGFDMKFLVHGLLRILKSNNNHITKEMQEQLKKSRKGDMIIIDNIKANLSDGTERTLPPIIIRVI